MITLYNSLSMSLYFGQCYGKIEHIFYKNVSYCYFKKAEIFSRIKTYVHVFYIGSKEECFMYLFSIICCTNVNSFLYLEASLLVRIS